jgi:CheY-like chemotaxis protein
MTASGSHHELTILVVEDEPIVRNLMVKVLGRAHYRILEADSAAEALEVSDTFGGIIDLLITDHALKAMTGRQVAEKIKQSRAGLKIIHMSGYPIETLEEQGGLTPGAEFLAKPFLPQALIEKVKCALGSPSELGLMGHKTSQPSTGGA